jgi:hypothetical protein
MILLPLWSLIAYEADLNIDGVVTTRIQKSQAVGATMWPTETTFHAKAMSGRPTPAIRPLPFHDSGATFVL